MASNPAASASCARATPSSIRLATQTSVFCTTQPPRRTVPLDLRQHLIHEEAHRFLDRGTRHQPVVLPRHDIFQWKPLKRLLDLLAHRRWAPDPHDAAFVQHFGRDRRRVFARVRDGGAEAERREPRRTNKRARCAPQRPRLFVGIGYHHVAEDADTLARLKVAPGTVCFFVIDAEEELFECRVYRRKDRLDAVPGAPANRRLAKAERLHDRRVGLLNRLRHHTNLAYEPALHAASHPPRRFEVPRDIRWRDLPELALVVERVLGPGEPNDLEELLEGGTVDPVDLCVPLLRRRGMDIVVLLRERIDPAPLIAARE